MGTEAVEKKNMVEGGAYSPFKVRRGGKKEERLIDLCFLRDRHIDSLFFGVFGLW